jgi:hypothetical protein
MTMMDQDRALEIIASYGANAQRWPLRERDALLDLAHADAVVQAAIAAAEPLDAALHSWAGQDATTGSADTAALAALAAVPARPRWWGGAVAGGAIAASVALAVAVLPTGETLAPTPAMQPSPATTIAVSASSRPAIRQIAAASTQPKPIAAISDADADAMVFAMMFTETPEEEMYL